MQVRKPISRFSLLIFTYVGLMLLWFISWLTVGDANWVLTLLNRAVPYLFLPIPILGAPGLLIGRRKFLLTLVVPLLIFCGLYTPYLSPKFEFTAPQAADFRVMTYNVLYTNKHYDAVAEVIKTYKPDLIGLQEVQPEMMSALVERLRDNYAYALMGTPNPFGTTAVFSRTPFTEKMVLDLQTDRPAVVVTTLIQNHPITFATAHLLPLNLYYVPFADIPRTAMEFTASQNRQGRILLQELDTFQGVKIIGCDCNMYETSSTYRIINQIFSSAARQVGWVLNQASVTGTHQETDPNHIDHIFYQGALQPVRVSVIQDMGGSDHNPVMSEFAFH